MAIKILMPKLSDTMEEGTIISWYMDEGDEVKAGDAIAEVETDKAVMDLQSFSSGILRKKLLEPGQAAPIGELIAVLGTADEDISDIVGGGAEAKPAAPAPKPAEEPKSAAPAPAAPAAKPVEEKPKAAAAPSPAPPVESGEGRLMISPAARKLAEEKGVDLAKVHGTGPEGRIVEKDILDAAGTSAPAAAAPKPAAKPTPTPPVAAPAVPGEVKDLSQMRKAIVRQMAKSKAPVPHFYLTMEIPMEKALEVVAEVKETHPEVKIGVNDLVIKAAAESLKKFPQLNSSYVEENKVKVHKAIDIGVAVGLEDGLITPVIRDCGNKALKVIAAEGKVLVERARKRGLQPDEYTGATFTITNLGMFGVESFIAVINPPEAAILAIGTISDVPVVAGSHVKVGKRMMVTLSCDHRVVDGMQGAQFLQEFRHLMENPVGLVV
ncbi:MAG: 2-oxo acid dehydrogenase subunit E2 [Nitrospirota bacterium]|nr:2-oxo acid dehydrogenase subunit E2 [Nitrospirota bacterium]